MSVRIVFVGIGKSCDKTVVQLCNFPVCDLSSSLMSGSSTLNVVNTVKDTLKEPKAKEIKNTQIAGYTQIDSLKLKPSTKLRSIEELKKSTVFDPGLGTVQNVEARLEVLHKPILMVTVSRKTANRS